MRILDHGTRRRSHPLAARVPDLVEPISFLLYHQSSHFRWFPTQIAKTPFRLHSPGRPDFYLPRHQDHEESHQRSARVTAAMSKSEGQAGQSSLGALALLTIDGSRWYCFAAYIKRDIVHVVAVLLLLPQYN